MRVITVTQSGSGVTGSRRTQVIVSRTGPQGASGGAGTIALDDLTDVALVGTTSGDFLRYNGTAWTDTKLVAGDLADGTSGSSTYLRGDRTWQTHNIDALTDVVITAAASGDFLRNNGTSWVDATITAGDLGTGTADTFHFLAGDLTWQDAVPLDVSAKNTTASTIPKGTPVYITGSVGSGHTVEVAPANAASSGTMAAIGLTVTALTANQTGYVRTMGVLEDVSTGAYSINQTLFVASGGGLTNVRPTGTTTLVQNIGRVMRANNNTGSVLIMGPGRTNDVPNRIATTYLADGTAGASNYLRGDQTWSSISAADVSAAPTSRLINTSTGLTGGGDLSADRTLSVLYGTTAGSAAQGNDARLSDARTPTTHATSHQDGGSDELALDASQVTTGTVATARLGSGTASVNTFLRGDQTYQPVPVGNNDMGRVSNAIYLTGSGLSLNGATSGNTATTPDAAALDITGDIEIVVRAAATDWASASTLTLVAKRQTASTMSYRLQVLNGFLYLTTSTTGSDIVSTSSSVVVGFSAGQAGWVRATRNATTGAVIYYTAADSTSEPSSWTQLGTTQSTAASNIYNSNSQLEIGTQLNGTAPFGGTIYRAIVRSGIGGTTVFDANFATAAADALAFTESSSNAATVTITTTRYAYGIPNAQFTVTGTQALTANTVYYQPFEVTAPLTIDFMALEVTTAAAGGGNLRLGVYAADANLQPTGAPVFDSGDITVTAAATGILSKQGTPVTLQPGVYLTAANTSAAFTARTFLGGIGFVQTTMGANLNVLNLVSQTQGAFPTPGTAWSTRTPANGAPRHVTLLRWR
jgi:hypothetical protein